MEIKKFEQFSATKMAIRSTKTKEQIYRDAFECLTNGKIPD